MHCERLDITDPNVGLASSYLHAQYISNLLQYCNNIKQFSCSWTPKTPIRYKSGQVPSNTYCWVRYSNQVYLIYNLSGELTVILITIWWLQLMGRLTVSKQTGQKFDAERFNLRKLSEMEVRKQYQINNLNQICSFRQLKWWGHKQGLGEH